MAKKDEEMSDDLIRGFKLRSKLTLRWISILTPLRGKFGAGRVFFWGGGVLWQDGVCKGEVRYD